MQEPKIKLKKKSLWKRDKNSKIYSYYNGLQLVKPHYLHYKTFCKSRWIGREVLEIYTTDFLSTIFDEEYYKKEIKRGKITVNGEKTTETYKLLAKDVLEHLVHRHELPCLDEDLDFFYVDENYIALNKPCSIPVHQGGKYSYNSITWMLKHQYGINKKLYPIHRLDRLTSGIFILARKRKIAIQKHQEVLTSQTSKHYLAGLEGKIEIGKVIKVKNHLGVIDKKRGKSGIIENPQDSETKTHLSCSYFYGVEYNKEKNLTLVIVKLKTGRTHQIRIHSKFLGAPVFGDPLYGSGKEIEIKDHNYSIPKENYDDFCVICNSKQVLIEPETLKIYLHSWKYRGKDLDLTSPTPKWTRKYFKLDDKELEEKYKKLHSEVMDMETKEPEDINLYYPPRKRRKLKKKKKDRKENKVSESKTTSVEQKEIKC